MHRNRHGSVSGMPHAGLVVVLDIESSNHGGQLHSGFAVVAPLFAHVWPTLRPLTAGRLVLPVRPPVFRWPVARHDPS